MSRICLYYRPLPERDRWVRGDRHIRPLIRRIVRGKPRPGGVDLVFINLLLGLDQLHIKYSVNLPFNQLRDDDRIGVLGRGRGVLAGYDRPNPIVAGIGLMTHPTEWPTLCDEFPVVTYLSHCEWVNDIYRPFYGDRCKLWAVGIDTDAWRPSGEPRAVDRVLVYNKIERFPQVDHSDLREAVLSSLRSRGVEHEELVYGSYTPREYQRALRRASAMVFLCSHESQGLACLEAMSSGVPVLAYDPGFCEDPNRFEWGQAVIPATSVPFFDARCGLRFKDVHDFGHTLDEFMFAVRHGHFRPREYVLENLTLAKCSGAFVHCLNESHSADARQRLAPRFREHR